VEKGFKYAGYGITGAFTLLNTGIGIGENIHNGEPAVEIASDALIDLGSGALSIFSSVKIGAAVGTTISPGVGTLIGLGVGLLISGVCYIIDEYVFS